MKKLTIKALLLLFASSCTVSEDPIRDPQVYACSPLQGINGEQHVKASKYQTILDETVSKGVPGIIMTVFDGRDGHGPWTGSSGKADLKNNVSLENCNITRVGSTVKTFTAVTILKLAEEGKLDLDDIAAQYLPEETITNIENADSATIRNLLQHSSGIYNYIQSPHFQTASLNDLLKEWQPNELLGYARGKKANFEPGTDVDYSNTNYILLGMIIEEIEDKPFYQVFDEFIFGPLGLTFTSFASENPVPENIIRGYIDLYGKLEVIDATQYSGWDYHTADGGLISNPYDLYLFLQAVVETDIISQNSLEEMTEWISPSYDDEIFYGLGLFKMKTKFGDTYMHSGDAIGYYASMLYLPDYDSYICWAVNGNYGKIDEFTQSKKAIELFIEKVIF